MMVVAAGRDEEGTRVAADRDIEAERAGVEGLGGAQIADVQVDVADPGAGWHAGVRILAAELIENAVEVERQGVHLEDAVAYRPLLTRAVAIELDSVALRVAQIERLADQVVGGPAQPPARFGDALQRTGEVRAARNEDGEVEEPAGAVGAARGVRVAGQLDDGLLRGVRGPHAEGAVRALELG